MAEKLATYAADVNYADIPPDVVHQAKRILVDTVGCAFGGYDSNPARMACLLASRISSTEPATVLFTGQQTSPDLATFANGVMARYLDFNDGTISEGGGHPSDSICALLAAAELAGASGRELILAIVLTYEVYCRFVDAIDLRPYQIDHVTVGGLASAVGAARLLRLTVPQIVEAINIVLVANIALRQTRTGNLSHWKCCAYPNASRNAVFSVQLAAAGMTGPSPIFEGRHGFFKAITKQPFDLAVFGGKGQPYRIMQCHLKQFPLGNFAQTVVTAALQARASIMDVRDIAEVRIHTSQKGLDVMASDPEKWRPTNRETADHSMPYTAAVALMYGTIDHTYFDDKYLYNPELLDLVARIKCDASDEANRRVSECFLCEIELVMRSGERKWVRSEYHRGHWRNPMSEAEIETKFRSLVADMLPKSQVDALLQQLWDLENLPQVRTLMQMTTPPA